MQKSAQSNIRDFGGNQPTCWHDASNRFTREDGKSA